MSGQSDSPFPTPAELTRQQRAAVGPEVERLRELVRKAFGARPPYGSSYSVVAKGFSESAIRIVSSELAAAGWRVRRGGQRDEPGEFFVDPA